MDNETKEMVRRILVVMEILPTVFDRATIGQAFLADAVDRMNRTLEKVAVALESSGGAAMPKTETTKTVTTIITGRLQPRDKGVTS